MTMAPMYGFFEIAEEARGAAGLVDFLGGAFWVFLGAGEVAAPTGAVPERTNAARTRLRRWRYGWAKEANMVGRRKIFWVVTDDRAAGWAARE